MMAPRDLGLREFGDDGIVAAISGLPRRGTVSLMAWMTRVLHSVDETDADIQRRLAATHLQPGPRTAALERLDRLGGGVIFTYEACARIAALAFVHGRPEGPDLDDTAISFVMSLVPEVQARLSRLETLEQDHLVRGTDAYHEDTALTMFLSANSPGRAGAVDRHTLDAIVIGHGAIRHLRRRTARLVDRYLQQHHGATLVEMHAAAVHLAEHFLYGRPQWDADEPPQRFINLGDVRGRADRLHRLVVNMAQALVATPPSNLSLCAAVAPRPCFPPGMRWRPLAVVDGHEDLLVCWDPRTLHDLLGAMFLEWMRRFIRDEKLFATFEQEWGRAVERAMGDMVAALEPSWAAPRVERTNCDGYFVDGDDLFLVEVKNSRPSPGLFTLPSVKNLRAWLDRFFVSTEKKRTGFPQCLHTAAQLQASGNLVGGRPIGDYRAIWPIVVCWPRVPQHTVFTDLLQRMYDGVESPDLGDAASLVRPPLLIGFETFLEIMSMLPDARGNGVALGPFIDGFLRERVNRPFTIATALGNALPGATGVPAAVIDGMDAALGTIHDVGNRMRAEPAP